MSSQPPSAPPPSNEFRPEKFTRRSGPRDYLIYGLVAVFLAAVIGAAGYYLSDRGGAEADRRQAPRHHR